MTPHHARRLASSWLRLGWRWWLTQLRALAPAALHPTFDRQLAQALLEIDPPARELRLFRLSPGAPPRLLATLPHSDAPLPDFTPLPALLADAGLPPGAIALRLAPSMLLRRSVSLPAAPPRLLRSLLDHQMPRLSPLPANQLCFDARILLAAPRGGRMLVELAAMERAAALRLLHAAAAAGLTVTHIGCGPPTSGPPTSGHTIDLLDDPHLPPPPRPRRRPPRPAVGLALLLAAALPAAATLRAHQAAAARDAALRAARTTLATTAALDARLRTAAEAAAFLPRQRRARTPAAIINEVARLLPQDSVLSDLTIDSDFSREGASVLITGTSRHPTDLIGRLAASTMFANPRFAAAITANPNTANAASERNFSIAVEVTPWPTNSP